VDSLTYLLDVLHPLGDALERVTIDNLLDNGTPVQKKRFIAAFWEKYYPLNTQAAYEDYMKVVQQMNRKYGTRALRGYRTDRGRVYLQYGAPDLVEERKYEPSMYPYEIWQYNRLNSNSSTPQVNRVFIFANLASGGDQYDVIHSNAEGEFFNDRWSIQLNRRVLPQMDIDENGSDVIQHGGRSNSNLIINGGSIDRVNRR
jgi:GWxTD domain-containing protein